MEASGRSNHLLAECKQNTQNNAHAAQIRRNDLALVASKGVVRILQLVKELVCEELLCCIAASLRHFVRVYNKLRLVIRFLHSS